MNESEYPNVTGYKLTAYEHRKELLRILSVTVKIEKLAYLTNEQLIELWLIRCQYENTYKDNDTSITKVCPGILKDDFNPFTKSKKQISKYLSNYKKCQKMLKELENK